MAERLLDIGEVVTRSGVPRDIDAAIDGLEHALECPNPSPLSCPGFHRHLREVLPRQ